MQPKLLVIQHEPDTSLGALEPALLGHGLELVVIDTADAERAGLDGVDGLIVLGGEMHPDNPAAALVAERRLIAEAHAGAVPVLGVCLGAQLVSQACGGSAGPAARSEIGWTSLAMTAAAAHDALLSGVEALRLFEWHSYRCTPPEDAVILAENDLCVQAFRIGALTWGIQFHVEVTPEIVAGWAVAGSAELQREGIDPSLLIDVSEQTNSRSMAVADQMARGFGALVRERAHAALAGTA